MTIVGNSLGNSQICLITWGSTQESAHSNALSQIAKCVSTSFPTRRSISLHTDAMICTFHALIAKLNSPRGRFSRTSISAIPTARSAKQPTSNNLRNFKTKKKVTHYLISKSLIKFRLVILPILISLRKTKIPSTKTAQDSFYLALPIPRWKLSWTFLQPI